MSGKKNFMDAVKGTRETNSGLPYQFLSSPGEGKIAQFTIESVDIPMINSKHPHKNISKISKFLVSCNSVRSICLPLDPETGANPREPTTTSSKSDVVKAMQNTLTKEPKMFDLKNGGITMVCQDFNFDDSSGSNKISISYKKWEGIVNGGHTYFSIQNMPDVTNLDSNVSIELIALSPSLKGKDRKEFIVQIASSRNRNSAIDDKSTANSMGYFNRWKKSLGSTKEHVEWKTNQTAYSGKGISAEEFIRRIHLFDFKQFRHHNLNTKSSASLHKKWSGSGPGAAHKFWFENTEHNNDILAHLAPLAPDIMKFVDYISHDLTKDKWKSNSLPVRHATPTMHSPISTKKKKLWGTAFGNWVKKGKLVPLVHAPNPLEGYKLPVTLNSIILGQFRDCVWGLHTNEALGQIGLIGWYESPIAIWDIAGPNLMGALSYTFEDNHDNDPVSFRKNSAFFLMESLEWSGKSAIKAVHDKPMVFYDLTDNNQQYVREDTNPTHYIELSFSTMAGDLVELHGNSLPDGKQGYAKKV